jgi:hypothetical protein
MTTSIECSNLLNPVWAAGRPQGGLRGHAPQGAGRAAEFRKVKRGLALPPQAPRLPAEHEEKPLACQMAENPPSFSLAVTDGEIADVNTLCVSWKKYRFSFVKSVA